MIKISIELNDIMGGDELRKTIINSLEQKGLLLPEKHAGLYLDDMAEVVLLDRTEDKLKLKIKHNSHQFIVLFPQVNEGILKAGLACLYGFGHLKYNYGLPVFHNLSEKEFKKYMELAVEIWERNIHKDWMKRCGYKTHNGTKDELFLYQAIEGDIKTMKKTHWERSERREKGDTPHHLFSDPDLVREVILEEGLHELTPYFIESFYDKVTAVTRYWYKLRKDQIQSTFEQRLMSNRDAGYYVNEEFRWKKGCFGFTNDYEAELEQLWLKVHDEFKGYWVSKFGKNEELWQLPAPLEILKK